MNETNGTDAIPLSRLRARLARPRGYKRVDALLSAENAAAEVGALPISELYGLVAEVGFADAHELIALATPEQLQGCVDLSVWDKDRLQLEAIKPWLAVVVSEGFEHLGRAWNELDPELRALVIQRWTHIYDLSLGEDPDDHPDDDRPVYTTPDQFFAVRLTAEDENTRVLTQRIIDDLYRADMELARHTLMAARSEPPGELEEMSYRWRSGRLADMGYVDFYDALEIYRPLDASSVSIGENTHDEFPDVDREPGEVLPIPIAETVVGRSFLARALDRVTDVADAERLETAIVVLVNKVLAAARVSPGDTEAVSVGADHATATLALGLETVSGGDVERAAHALATVSLTRLHRIGYTTTLPLARVARRLAPRAAAAGHVDVALIEALLGPRPFFPRELDDPVGDGPRPFESTQDVRAAATQLAELAMRIAMADSLGVDTLALSQQAPGRELDDFARTALARLLTGGRPEASPLSRDELAALRDLIPLPPEAVAEAVTALGEHLAQSGTSTDPRLFAGLARDWLARIVDELGGIPAGAPIDPRFIGGLIIGEGLE